MKRLFDVTMAAVGLVMLSPLFLVVMILVKLDSKGPSFFVQQRVGKHGKLFGLLKFRTMRVNAERNGQLTIGDRDPRVTKLGYTLRKYKIDELPQLLNVIVGDMSLVGPRPEVSKYVALYDEDQRQVLNVRPGVTDPASITYINESDLLKQFPDPEQAYIDVVMPRKLAINLAYLQRRTFFTDLQLIFRTIGNVLRK